MIDWKLIDGFEDYAVSSQGAVKRATRAQGTVAGQEIKRHTQTSTGYPNVRLRKEGKTVTVPIHRLVALAFLGPRPDGAHIRHLDGDKSNICAANLAYGTASENAQDKIAHGRSFFTGSTNPKAKLTPDTAQQIRALRSCGVPSKAIADGLNLNPSTVYRIVAGKYWKEASNRTQDRVMR